MKIAIITDSNSGITKEMASELNIHVIPMPFMIDGETYYEELTLSRESFYEKLEDDAEILTSQPSMADTLDLYESLLKTYDEIVHLPMSSALSGTCETAAVLAKDFGGKVQVVDNLRISVTLKQAVYDAIALVELGKSAQEIKSILEDDKYNASVYIMVDTLKYLKKGGRITPAAATLGTMLKIKPILQIQGEKLDAFAKARTVNQGKILMLNAIKNDMETRFGGIEKSKVRIDIVHAQNEEAAVQLQKKVQLLYPDLEVGLDCLSLSVACHIGPGALAITCIKTLEV